MNRKKFTELVFDYGVALYVVSALIMLIIPIPAWLMDLLLAVDLSIAFAILFNAMYVKEALDMSFYPTMLLCTTVFRIALNVPAKLSKYSVSSLVPAILLLVLSYILSL